MATTNYNNRKTDLLMVAVQPKQGGATLSNFDFGLDTGGKICTSVIKLQQKVIVLLLTQFYYYDTFWGTDLPKALFGGSVQQAYDLITNTFTDYSMDVLNLLKSQETTNTPRDERITGLSMTGSSYDVDTGSITISLALSTSTGVSEFVLPIARPL